jgi:hypothetical protein
MDAYVQVPHSDSDDSVDQAIRTSNSRRKSRQSLFRDRNGEPFILQPTTHASAKAATTSTFVEESASSSSFHQKIEKFGNSLKSSFKKDKHLDTDEPILLFESTTPQVDSQLENPDQLPRHTSPERIVENQGLHAQHRRSLSKVSFVLPESENQSDSAPATIKQRVKSSDTVPDLNKLTIDTSVDRASASGNSYSARSAIKSSSTVTLSPDYPDFGKLVDSNQNLLESGNHNNKGRNYISIAFQEFRFTLLTSIGPRTENRMTSLIPHTDIETIKLFQNLAEKLKFRPVFFDPELDILNRYCLEFTSIGAKTMDTSLSFFKKENPISRVYKYMDSRVNSTSTPLDEEPLGPDIPVLLTQLFLNQFRVKSNGMNEIKLLIPIFSHSNRLSEERFAAITRAVFDRRDFFYKNIDIARHGLAHLA